MAERDECKQRLADLEDQYLIEIQKLKTENSNLTRQLDSLKEKSNLTNWEFHSQKIKIAELKKANSLLQDHNNELLQCLTCRNEKLLHCLSCRNEKLAWLSACSPRRKHDMSEHSTPARGSSNSDSYIGTSLSTCFITDREISGDPVTPFMPRRRSPLQACRSAPALTQKKHKLKVIKRRSPLRGVMKKLLRSHPAKYSAQAVDHAVKELVDELESMGLKLPLERVKDFTYSLYQRQLRLNVLSGKLHVRTGGGYQDLLAFLDRTQL